MLFTSTRVVSVTVWDKLIALRCSVHYGPGMVICTPLKMFKACEQRTDMAIEAVQD